MDQVETGTQYIVNSMSNPFQWVQNQLLDAYPVTNNVSGLEIKQQQLDPWTVSVENQLSLGS